MPTTLMTDGFVRIYAGDASSGLPDLSDVDEDHHPNQSVRR